MNDNKAILEVLDSKQADIVRDLCQFVRIGSVSCDPVKVAEALKFILDLARKFGFDAEPCLNGQVGVIETGEGSEILGILSHVDVVEPGNLEKWETKPFEPVIKDGRIYGRGTLDDKGAIIACLYAMKAVCGLGKPLRKKIRLILGTQEEVEWTDMKAYVKKYPLPDYGFTPDGEFPLCNIEKGCMDVVLSFPLDNPGPDNPGPDNPGPDNPGPDNPGLDNPGPDNPGPDNPGPDNPGSDKPGPDEPAETDQLRGRYLTSIEAGSAPNIVPGVCTAEITEYTDGKPRTEKIKVYGKAVHSCQPEKGENAILKMAGRLSGMGLNNNKLFSLLSLICEKLGDVYGKGLGLESESEYCHGEFVHRNVFTPTVLRIENGAAILNVNVRFPYGADEKDIINGFEKLAENGGGALVRAESLPAVYISRNRPFLQTFAAAYEEVTGRTNEFTLAYGGSYAKAMPNIVSWGPIFPGEEDTCHEENEYISIKSLMDNAKIFAAAISKIVLNQKSFK